MLFGLCLFFGAFLLSCSFFNFYFITAIDEGTVRTETLEPFRSSSGARYNNYHYKLKLADEAQEIQLELLRKEVKFKELEFEKQKQQATSKSGFQLP